MLLDDYIKPTLSLRAGGGTEMDGWMKTKRSSSCSKCNGPFGFHYDGLKQRRIHDDNKIKNMLSTRSEMIINCSLEDKVSSVCPGC